MPAKKLILTNDFSPGDVVMLTAAVRDLHNSVPNRFVTDIRTPCPELWENNPYITPIRDGAPDAAVIACHYPLINHSNSEPFHLIHGFAQFLEGRLDVRIRPTAFRGAIHISDLEKSWFSQVREILGTDIPFWITAADVIRAIESYHHGGAARFLTPEESRTALTKLNWHPPLPSPTIAP